MSRRSGIGAIVFWSLSPMWAGLIVMYAVLVLTWYVLATPYYIYQAIRKDEG